MRACALLVGVSALLPSHKSIRAVRRRAADDESQNFEVVGSQTVSLKSQFERALVLQRAGDVAGALAASLLSTAASPQRGLYLAALGYAVVYGVSLAVYRRVLGDVSDDSGSAPCSIFLELPARDVQRIVDDMTEGDEV